MRELAVAFGLATILISAQAQTPVHTSEAMPPSDSTVHGNRLSELPLMLQIPAVLPVSLAASGAAGRTPTPSEGQQALALTDAIGRGLSSNLDVRAAQFRTESFVQTRNAARGALLPRIELQLAVGEGRLENVRPFENRRRLDGKALLSQAIVNEPARREWKRQSILADSSMVQFEGTQSSSSLEVATAYLQLMQSRLVIELGGDYEVLLVELLRYMTDRVAGGGASKADLDRVRARVANARASLSDAKANFTTALRNLQRLIGEVPDALLVAGPTGLQIPESVEAAHVLALQNNHDLRAAQAEIKAANMERLANGSRFLPSLSVELSHGRNINASGAESYFRETKAMVVLTVPLVNGGTDLSQFRAAAARREEQTARALNIQRKLQQDLEAAYANLDATAKRDRAVREELQANRAVVAAFKEQLTGANRSLLDVLDAYQRFHQSKLDLTGLLVSEAQTQLRVAHLTGLLLPALSGAVASEPSVGH